MVSISEAVQRAREGQEIRGHKDAYWYPEESELLASWDCNYEGIGGGKEHYKGRLYRTRQGSFIKTCQYRHWFRSKLAVFKDSDEFASDLLTIEDAFRKLRLAAEENGLDSKLELTAAGRAFYEQQENKRLSTLKEV